MLISYLNFQVRERSSRSVPMTSKTPGGRSSFSAGTPDSLSDNEGGLRPLRKASAPVGRSSLTPGARNGN
jgi:dystonin